MSVATSLPADQLASLVWRVTAHGLPGTPGRLLAGLDRGAPDDEPLAPDDWARLLRDVVRHRVPGFLVAALEAGALSVTDEQRAEALARHLDACSAVLGLERRLLDVVGLLEDAGIEVVALKGSAHAHLLYRDPGLRFFGDVDVLLRSEQLGTAVGLLERERGAVREVPELRPGFDRRFTKSVTLRDADGTELDVHRTLLFGTFGLRIDPDELFTTSVPVTIGGREVRALGPEARLLHVCYHAGLGDKRPRGNSMRDLAQMLLVADHDPDRVLALARRWRSEAVLARGVALCRDVLGVEVGGPVAVAAAAYQPSRRDRRAIASYVGPRSSHGAKVGASVPFCTSPVEAGRFVWSSLVPSRTFLRTRARGRAAWLRRGLRRVLRR
jgi:hypothetical protein